MTAEVRTVKTELIDPNPFRDGCGGSPAATWESVAAAYGYDKAKIEELKASIQQNGLWTSLIVRPNGARYQLAFGHHRMQAAREVGLAEIPVVVEALGDNEMLQRMAAENSEEYGHDFALGVVNAIEAVVKAYAAGFIELDKVDPNGARLSRVRNAPSFLLGVDVAVEKLPRAYTSVTVAKYLGWVVENSSKGPAIQAQDKVQTALSALELIELGVLKRPDLKGLGAAQAKDLVVLTKRKMDSAREQVEAQKGFLETQRAKALQEDDKRSATNVNRKISELGESGQREIVRSGREAVSTVKEFYRGNMSDALRKSAETLQVSVSKVPRKARLPEVLTLSDVDNFCARLDSILRSEDATWLKLLEFAGKSSNSDRTFRSLADSLQRLSTRAKDREEELLRVRGQK